MPKSVRTFIACELPRSVRSAIADYVQALRVLPGRVSWVKPENIHLTLKFLGDVPEKNLDEIAAALREASQGFHPMQTTAKGCGVFPNARHPRVLWVGLEDESGILQKLAAEIDQRLRQLGFPKEDRRFSPHLTIGRVRDGAVDKIITAMQERPFIIQPVQFTEIILMRSQLHAGGSIYTPIRTIKFNDQ
jgi:2'-5' RNA ligase